MTRPKMVFWEGRELLLTSTMLRPKWRSRVIWAIAERGAGLRIINIRIIIIQAIAERIEDNCANCRHPFSPMPLVYFPNQVKRNTVAIFWNNNKNRCDVGEVTLVLAPLSSTLFFNNNAFPALDIMTPFSLRSINIFQSIHSQFDISTYLRAHRKDIFCIIVPRIASHFLTAFFRECTHFTDIWLLDKLQCVYYLPNYLLIECFENVPIIP